MKRVVILGRGAWQIDSGETLGQYHRVARDRTGQNLLASGAYRNASRAVGCNAREARCQGPLDHGW